MQRQFIILPLLLIFAFRVFSQPELIDDPWMKFSHLSKDDGLSSNYIFGFLQDHEGYMWIATRDGLNRFDGYSVTQFRHDPHNFNSLSDDLVTCLAESNDSLLWVGTRTGLNIYNKSDEKFTRQLPLSENADILAGSHVRAMLADGDQMWVETAKGELFRINCKKDQLKVFKHNPPTMVNTYFYHSIFKGPDSNLYLGGRYMGLYVFNPANETFRHIKNDPDDPNKKRDEDATVYFTDSQGKYRVGGIDGLYTFDPVSENFNKQLAVSTFDMAEPVPGKLWIATGSGLYIYDLKNKTFKITSHNDNLPQSISHDHINKLYVDKSGNVWIATLDGVDIYHPSQNKFGHIFHVPENENSLISNHITAICTDKKNRIWIGTKNGLECFSSAWEKLFQYSASSPSKYRLASDAVSGLMVDRDGDIWVGQWSGRGFNIINPDNNLNLSFNLLPNELKADWYNDIFEDKEGNVWLGLWGAQGLYRFDKKTGQFGNERFINLYGPIAQPVKSMAWDGKMIWLGSDPQNRFNAFDPLLEKVCTYSRKKYYHYDFTRIDSLLSKGNSIVFFTNNGIYKKGGTASYTFNEIDHLETDGIFQKSDTLKKEIARSIGTGVNSLATDSAGFVWVATNKGLYKTAGNLPVSWFHVHDGKSSAMLSDTIYSLLFLSPDILWLGTQKGLVKFMINQGKFINFKVNSGKYISSHLVKFIEEDKHGRLWIGTTDKGLNCLDPVTGNIVQYLSDPADMNAFWGDEATCFAEDQNNDLWFGGKGLNKWNPVSGHFTHFTNNDGLTDNEVRAIIPDAAGCLWISTANGLSHFNPQEETFTNYYKHDGLQDNEFSNAACDLGNGTFAFGGKNGLSIFEPDKIIRNEIPPLIKVTGFQIFEKDHPEMIRRKEPVKLKYNQNYFSFSFTALDFSDPENNQYAYMLENFDNEWINTSAANRVARYTNVDPGKYIFRVKAANSDGFWNEAGISIPMIISPPFWRTNLFYGLILVSLAFLIFIWVKQREKKIRGQNRYLLLEQRLLRSQMNPHFIFNSLSAIQSFIFENNPVEAGSYLSRFADLIRSILYSSREEYITLEKEIQTLRNYLDLQQLRFNNKFSYEIFIDPELELETIKIPPMLAQPFIENAIEHGLKDLDRPGRLKVSFTFSATFLNIRVEDNGIGIEEAMRLKRTKSNEHKSLATKITKERIEILNKGRKQKLYAMQFASSRKNNEPKEGTEVLITIPLE